MTEGTNEKFIRIPGNVKVNNEMIEMGSAEKILFKTNIKLLELIILALQRTSFFFIFYSLIGLIRKNQ